MIGLGEHEAPADASQALGRFCALVLGDVSLQEVLEACQDRGHFAALVAEVARSLGIELTAASIEGAMLSPLFGIEQHGADIVGAVAPPPGWLPVRAFWRERELFVRWSHFGDRRLREPFFEGDVRRALGRPFNQLLRYVAPIASLADRARTVPGLQPSGLVFHMSRCGSTLVMQMLAALDQNIAISEASPIDAVVRAREARPDLSPDEQARWLRRMVGALAPPRLGERHSFIKLDCWHTLALPLFQRAFPDVPWVFLYRDPVEVLVSQLAMPGTQMIPGTLGADLYGLGSDYDPSRPEDYYARVLARILAPVPSHYGAGQALLINYSELPEAVWTKILPHFGVTPSDSDRIAMQEVTRRDAKARHLGFSNDSQSKQQAATAATRTAAAKWLGGIYAELEALRSAGTPSA